MKKIIILLILFSLSIVQMQSQTRLDTCIQNMQTSYNNEDYDNAIIALNEAISIDPTLDRLYGWRGLCYKYKSEWVKALADFTKSLELNPADTLSMKQKAEMKMELSDYRGAVADYNIAIAKTNNALCIYNRGRCYFEMHDFEAARTDLMKAAQFYPKFAYVHYLIGLTHLTNGTEKWYDRPLNEAYWAFKSAFDLDSTKFDSRLGMLQYKIRRNDYDGVDAALKALGSDFPNRAEVSYERGLASFLQKDDLSALYMLNKAIIVNPRYAEAYLLRGKMRMSMGSYSDAVKDFSDAISLDSLLWEPWLLRGKIRVQSLFGVGSAADFTRSLECAGPKGEAYRCRAKQKLASRDLVGAEQDYRAAVYDDFGKTDIRVEWGNVFLLMQDIPNAYKVFHDINTDMDPFPQSLCGEAHCLLRQNKNRDALALYEKALKMDGSYRAAFVGIGRVKAQMKKYDEAIEALTQAIKLKDTLPDAYYERACVYLSLKNKEKACSDLSIAAMFNYPGAKEMSAANCQ